MPFSNSSLSAQVKSYLTFLPEEIRQKILEHLHGVIHYEPVIGIMGKSGTGKSSLCNAIFQSRICATHPLNGCTRQAHRLTLQLGERRMTLVDLPGIGETPQHDQEYRALYRQLLPELDLIICKRAARTVLTGMCYSVGSATRQGEQFADPVYRP
ncbi:YfjP family GTPase, partial [Escherichia coli]|uniref:YfjP family GTPase n=1 Tax=Escherichia coli TaxID=562 RepID=UPI003A835BB7